MRVLFARAGKPYCPKCGKEIRKMTKEEIVDAAMRIAKKTKNEEIIILAPAVKGRKGEYYQLLYDFLNGGFQEARVDGKFISLRERVLLSRHKKHTIELVVDRIPASFDFSAEGEFKPKADQPLAGANISCVENKENRLRLSEAVETAIKYGNDVLTVASGSDETSLSVKFTCPNDNFSFTEIEPRLFSFNSPYGACPACHGLGVEEMWSEKICLSCKGKRLKEESLNVLISGKNIASISSMSAAEAYNFFSEIEKSGDNDKLTATPLREIKNRLRFLIEVGLGYLTLDRKAGTLSGGEAQRIRLASQIGSRLSRAFFFF